MTLYIIDEAHSSGHFAQISGRYAFVQVTVSGLDVIVDSQERANEVLAVARAFLVHADFPGRLNLNAGNVAFPFSPSDVEVGTVFEFLRECVVVPEDPLQLVRIEIGEVGA